MVSWWSPNGPVVFLVSWNPFPQNITTATLWCVLPFVGLRKPKGRPRFFGHQTRSPVRQRLEMERTWFSGGPLDGPPLIVFWWSSGGPLVVPEWSCGFFWWSNNGYISCGSLVCLALCGTQEAKRKAAFFRAPDTFSSAPAPGDGADPAAAGLPETAPDQHSWSWRNWNFYRILPPIPRFGLVVGGSLMVTWWLNGPVVFLWPGGFLVLLRGGFPGGLVVRCPGVLWSRYSRWRSSGILAHSPLVIPCWSLVVPVATST